MAKGRMWYPKILRQAFPVHLFGNVDDGDCEASWPAVPQEAVYLRPKVSASAGYRAVSLGKKRKNQGVL